LRCTNSHTQLTIVNDFLRRAVDVVRERFRGKVSYASLPFEGVDWSRFDIISTDAGYRTRETAPHFREQIRAFVAQGRGQGKPVAITEFGCMTYRGSAEAGGSELSMIEWGAHAQAEHLKGEYIRDETEQATYLLEVLDVFESEGVDSVFVYTFARYDLPHRANLAEDFDIASRGIVKVLDDRSGSRAERYPGMPWEPKRAFDALGSLFAVLILVMLACVAPTRSRAQCAATATSMTPSTWQMPAVPAPGRTGGLRLVKEIPLSGPANRFDYQSFDPSTGRIYMNHMDAGRTIVFDVKQGRVIAEVAGLPRATGVLAVPQHHQVYISAPGNHELVVVDDRTLKVVGRVGGIRFADGIAYAADADKVFVSDESGKADVVIDPKTFRKLSTIALGGEAGNTHYDSVSRCILVAVQTRNQLVAIDPATERIVHRYNLPGSDGPHGFAIDELGRLAFVSSEGNGVLQVVDLHTIKVRQTLRVADDPDVLAWDPSWRRLYVGAESGVLSAFVADTGSLRSVGVIRMPHAHTVSVDPRTHLVYVPLENVNGRPVLRIFEPLQLPMPKS
jgi:hypothetical protein